MVSGTDGYRSVYPVCRTLPTFDRLSDQSLREAIDASVDTYLPELQAFDKALPAHFHRKSEAAWLEFTCVTIHVSNLLAGSCLSPIQAAAIMKHVDLLYRVDDFIETLVDAYGIQDMGAAFEALQRCFQPYLASAVCSKRRRYGSGTRKVDSPVEDLPPIAKPIQLEQDLQDVVDRMHCHPICDADESDREWYSLELYDFFVAQLEQLDSELPETTTRGQVHKWVTDVGARSVGTKYMFAMFSCLVSAVEGTSLWKTASELYLAQELAQQISVEFRLLNDIGGRVRDVRDGTMSSCTLVGDGDYSELLKIAEYAAESSVVMIERLAKGSADEQNMRDLLGMFRMSVRISGELYMADEPNRVA